MKTKEQAKAAAPQRGPTEVKADELKNIARAELFPDPDQPRKTFSEASLDELARSIMEQGLVQPLIVRFVPAKFKLSEPDLYHKDWHVWELAADGHWDHAFQGTEAQARSFAGEQNLKDRFVIIAGERRWRASAARTLKTATGEEFKWAGLSELPCVVRDVDGGSATGLKRKFAQQLIENNQRENVSAIEEAEALEREFNRRRTTEPELSKEAFAKEVGMSRADFYGTLVLTRLHPPVRAALTAGKISTSLAKVVAQVPEPKQQEKLLKQITNEGDWQYLYSVREVQDLVEDEYVKNLNEAPFKKDATFEWSKDYPQELRSFVGMEAKPLVLTCEECPHRSGNMVVDFPDLAKRPNVCTHPHCFAVKCKAHWLQTAEGAKTAGKTVLTETEFRKQKSGYIAGDKHEYAQNKSGTTEELMGRHQPEPVLVATKDGLKKFYKKEEAAEAFKKNGVKFHREAVTQTAEGKAQGGGKGKTGTRQIRAAGAVHQDAGAGISRGAQKT